MVDAEKTKEFIVNTKYYIELCKTYFAYLGYSEEEINTIVKPLECNIIGMQEDL